MSEVPGVVTLRETLPRRQLGLDGVLTRSCPPSSSCKTGPATVLMRRLPVFSRPPGELGLLSCAFPLTLPADLHLESFLFSVILSRLPLNQSRGVNGVVSEKVNTFF